MTLAHAGANGNCTTGLRSGLAGHVRPAQRRLRPAADYRPDGAENPTDGVGNCHRAGDARAARDASKIFSGASTAFGAAPNTQACAVDLALPGVLPVLNRRGGRAGDPLRARDRRARSHARSVFARKNYFYPDLPKGYQISQYEMPIVARRRDRRSSSADGERRKRMRHHPRAPRGGRRQVAARGLSRHDRRST